jgi:hypothetical protein
LNIVDILWLFEYLLLEMPRLVLNADELVLVLLLLGLSLLTFTVVAPALLLVFLDLIDGLG